jgi:hypothetical protein
MTIRTPKPETMGQFFAFAAMAGIVYFSYRMFQKKKAMMQKKEGLVKVSAKKNGFHHSAHKHMTVSQSHVSGALGNYQFPRS